MTALDSELFLERANRVDCQFHGRASGVDVATVFSRGLVLFQPGFKPKTLAPPTRGCSVVIVDTQEPSNTKAMVALVARRLKEHPTLMAHIQALGGLCQTVQGELIGPCNWQIIGDHCTQAHGHLNALGVVSDKQNRVVEKLLEMGSWGAKMTGGGGGGSVISFFDPQFPLPLAHLHTLGGVCVSHVGPTAG